MEGSYVLCCCCFKSSQCPETWQQKLQEKQRRLLDRISDAHSNKSCKCKVHKSYEYMSDWSNQRNMSISSVSWHQSHGYYCHLWNWVSSLMNGLSISSRVTSKWHVSWSSSSQMYVICPTIPNKNNNNNNNNKQQTTNNKQQTTNNKQQTTTNKQTTNNKQQTTTDNQQPNNQQPTTKNQQPTTNNQQPQQQQEEEEEQEKEQAQKCDKKMCGKMVSSCGMKGLSHCALYLRARAEHMNSTNAHITILHNPYGIAGVQSSTIIELEIKHISSDHKNIHEGTWTGQNLLEQTPFLID